MAERQKTIKKQTAVAKLNDVPTSPRKMRYSADTIRGVEVNKALDILKYSKKEASNKLIMCTDDGTYGEKGFTTVFLKQEIEANIAEGKPQFDRVIAIGPDIMMKFLADVTRPYGISTIISLDPIMVDGTGMCGCCRVIVGGETKFACVDGPDFDAHQVDFDSLIKRAAFYKDEQDEAAKHICRITGGKRNG